MLLHTKKTKYYAQWTAIKLYDTAMEVSRLRVELQNLQQQQPPATWKQEKMELQSRIEEAEAKMARLDFQQRSTANERDQLQNRLLALSSAFDAYKIQQAQAQAAMEVRNANIENIIKDTHLPQAILEGMTLKAERANRIIIKYQQASQALEQQHRAGKAIEETLKLENKKLREAVSTQDALIVEMAKQIKELEKRPVEEKQKEKEKKDFEKEKKRKRKRKRGRGQERSNRKRSAILLPTPSKKSAKRGHDGGLSCTSCPLIS